MSENLISKRAFCILNGLSGIVGVALISLSFDINPGPPPGATSAALMEFGRQHYASILCGAWLQAVGPVLIVLFAFALVHLAGATQRLSGWMTFFGAATLMTVSLIEITFYISALHTDPPMMPFISLKLISAVQQLYFIVAAPALFLPLGIVLLSSSTPAIVCISGAPAGECFRSPGGHFSADPDAACASDSICRSPSFLVVGRCPHAHGSQWKNCQH